jgi:hypothetical protein
MIQNAFAVRPRSIFRAWDKSWKVLSNDTLSMTLSLIELDAAHPERKRVHYHPGQEIRLRWAPFNYRD